MSVQYLNCGTPASSDHVTAFSPGMPTGYSAGDLLICISYVNGGTGAGDIVQAASADRADVLSAIAAVADGGTVSIPAGSVTWSSGITIDKSITLQGAGGTSTHITGNFDSSIISINPATDIPIRITGLYLDKVTWVSGTRPAIGITGSDYDGNGPILTQIRIDNNRFNAGDRAIYSYGDVRGVIDHNYFNNCNIAISPTGDGHRSWLRAITPGTANALFIEDNTFYQDNEVGYVSEQIYHFGGARTVIRHNTFTGTESTTKDYLPIEAHANQEYWDIGSTNARYMRGCPIIEIYNNSMHCHHTYRMIYMRGGSHLIYNNTFVTDSGGAAWVEFDEEESWQTSFFSPLRTAWPAQDQINNTFVWNNTGNGSAITSIALGDSLDAPFIQENRDYFMHAPQASGGSESYTGSRAGGSTTAPTTSDTGSMTFSSSGANKYYPYTAYTYPHPMISGDSSTTQGSSWTTAFTNDTSEHFALVSYKWATSGSDSAPTITPSGGSPGKTQYAYVTAWRDADTTTPFPTPGAFLAGSVGTDIGPITAATASNAGAGGAVLVYGFFQRSQDDTRPIATLTGDGLTWAEIIDGGASIPDVQYIGRGTYTAASAYNATTAPPLPAGTRAGDLLVVLAYFRGAPAPTLTSSWTNYATNNDSATAIHVGYKIAVGGDAAPTVTPGGGSSNHIHVSVVVAFRNVNQSAPFGTHGTAAQYATGANIGPIAAATATTTKGAVLVVGGKNHFSGGAIEDFTVLTGDGLTWAEAVDYCSDDGTNSHIVADYAIWTAAPPTLTAKTLTPATSSGNGNSAGVMCLIQPLTNAGITAAADYATWASTVPTLTAKTFDLTYTGSEEHRCGQQLLIASSQTAPDVISYVGAGAVANAAPDDPITPALPAGTIAGDLLICFHIHRSASVTNAISSGWTLHAYNNDHPLEHIVWYRVATGGDADPTITPDGAAVVGQRHMACCIAFRGIDQTTPFGTSGVQFYAAPGPGTLGPIQPVTATGSSGVILVMGARAENAAGGTAGLLSGDGLTWVEAFDAEYTGTNPIGPFVVDYAIWTGGAPTVTAKTFPVTGGAMDYAVGRMYQLKAAPASGSLVSLVGTGTSAVGDHVTTLVPQIPSGVQNADFLLCLAYRQNAGTFTLGSQASGGRIYYYQETLARSTTAATSYSPKVSLQFTPSSGDRFLIIWNALVDDPSYANTPINVRLNNTTASAIYSQTTFAAPGSQVPHYAGGIAFYTATNTLLQTISIEYASGTANSTIGIAEASICAIKLGVDDITVESLTQTDSATTTYAPKATLAWTPGTAGDYLIIANAIAEQPSGSVSQWKMQLNNGTSQFNVQAPADYATAGDWKPYVAIARAVSISGAQSWTLEFARSVGAATVSVRSARMVALRLDGFPAKYWAEDRSPVNVTDTPWVDTAASVTATPNAYDHLIIASGIVTSNMPGWSTQVGNRISAGGTAYGAQYENPYNGNFFNWFAFKVRAETAVSTTWKTQANRLAGTYTGTTDENVIAVLQLGASGGGGTGGWTQHSIVNTTQNGVPFLLQTWNRVADGTQSAPYISITGGSTTPQTVTGAVITAYRNVNTTIPFGNDGSDSFNASAVNVGPIEAPSSLPSAGAVIPVAIRSAAWTSAATLTGDGISWSETVDNLTNTVGTASYSLAVDFATWQETPSITAKTFTVTGGSAAPGMGKMFVLNAAGGSGVATNIVLATADLVAGLSQSVSTSLDAAVLQSSVWVGPAATGGDASDLTPTLPTGLLNGDLLMAFGFIRNDGAFTVSDTAWTSHSLVDTFVNSNFFYLQTWYCVYDGTQAAPTMAISGGSVSPQTVTLAFVVAVRGVNGLQPFGLDGADSFNVSSTDIGPIAPPSQFPSNGIALVFGERHGDAWSSVATLSGGPTWEELFDNYTNSVAGVPIATVLDYAMWSGGAPTITAKTFVPTGGSAGPGFGKMFVLNLSAIAQTAQTIDLDVYVVTSAGQRDAFVSLDAQVTTATAQTVGLDGYLIIQTTPYTIGADLDVNVSPAANAVSVIGFFDVVVIPPPVLPGLPTTAVQDLSAQATENAWIVLITLSHDDMAFPIRVTSDSVPTTSAGDTYSPFAFEVMLPDDVDGRPPQSSLRIDNTTQEIVAALRSLVTPPILRIQIVRSITPDIVEYEWVGLEWIMSSYDTNNTVTGTLTVRDISREEFPFITFDSRWRGLWP